MRSISANVAAAVVAVLLVASLALAQITPSQGIVLYDENTFLGRIINLKFVGAGVVCTQTAGTGTCTVGGGGGGTVTQVNTSSPVTGGPITTTGTIGFSATPTACTNQVVTAISSVAVGTCSTVSNAMLANASTTVNGQTCTLGSTCTVTAAPSGSAGGDLSGTYPNPTVSKVNAVAYPASPSTNTVPVVTGANTVTYEAVPNAALANSTITVTAGTGMSGGGSVALGGTTTLTNAGVTSNVAGTGISVSGATGAVTITNTGVTSVATSSPITGGTITTTGTIACPTCNSVSGATYVFGSGSPSQGGIIGGSVSSSTVASPFSTVAGGTGTINITPGAGYWKNFSLNFAANQTAGIQGGGSLALGGVVQYGSELLYVSGDTSGVKRNSTHAVHVVRGNNLSVFTNFAGAGAAPTGWAAEYIMDDSGIFVGSYYNSTIGASTTSFLSPYGTTVKTSDALAGVPWPIAATGKNMCVRTSGTQNAGGSLVITLVVAGVASSVVATVSAGATSGYYCDWTHTAAINANDTLSLQAVNNYGGGVSAMIISVFFVTVPSSGTPGVIGTGPIGAVASGSTNYWAPFVTLSNATEANVRSPMPRPGTYTNLCAQRQVAASVGTTTVTPFKNGSATGQLVLTVGNATGVQCTTGSVSVAQGDTITFEVKNSVACTGGCPTLGGIAMDF